jgi:hypothetical protein
MMPSELRVMPFEKPAKHWRIWISGGSWVLATHSRYMILVARPVILVELENEIVGASQPPRQHTPKHVINIDFFFIQ